MKKLKYIFGIWLLISFCLTTIQKIHLGVIFFDIESISLYVNLFPFDFLVYLIRNITYLMNNAISFSINEIWFYIRDFVFNIILFIPSGICLSGMKFKLKKILISAFAIVSTYEVIQLALRIFNIGTSVFDINDIIAALIGAVIGHLGYRTACKHYKKITLTSK